MIAFLFSYSALCLLYPQQFAMLGHEIGCCLTDDRTNYSWLS